MNPVYNLFTPSSIFKKGAPPKITIFITNTKREKTKQTKNKILIVIFYYYCITLVRRHITKKLYENCRILIFPILSKLYI